MGTLESKLPIGQVQDETSGDQNKYNPKENTKATKPEFYKIKDNYKNNAYCQWSSICGGR